MGKNTIRELLRSSPERIIEVYATKNDPLIQEIESAGIPVKLKSKQELSSLVQTESHQNLIASVKERPQHNLKDFFGKSLVVMLDSIYDPQNMGTIMRAAECFGADLLVYSQNRGSDITPVVTKASSGASELLPIIKVANLAEIAKKFQKNDFWVVTAEAGQEAQSLHDFEFPDKTLLILGSEGKGVQKLLSKNADFHVYIPMLGKIDSLNVSQATAVLLSKYREQNRR